MMDGTRSAYMIKNYLTTAYRNLLRHKGASLIKLAGLSIGMCCCLLILVYLWDELRYNTFNTHYKDIYRVNYIKSGDGFRKGAGTPNAAGPIIPLPAHRQLEPAKKDKHATSTPMSNPRNA